MTIREAIDRFDEYKINTMDDGDKIRLLSNLDKTVFIEIISTHEDGESSVMPHYDDDTDCDTTLLVPAPYDDVYIYYLETMCDYANGETAKHANSSIMFNGAYKAYADYYNRTHMPKTARNKYY